MKWFKSLNKREKNIVRLMLLLVLVGVGLEGWDAYVAERTRLENDISSKNSQIATFAERLEGEHADKYRSLVAEIETDLEDVESKIMIMPQETDANLYMSQTISEVAEAAGLSINSISNRKSKPINEEQGLVQLRTYFGFDGDLGSLLIFFNALENQGYLMNMETLTISARRQPKRRRKNRKNTRVVKMNPLNGNATLRTVFKADPESSSEPYEAIRKRAVEQAKQGREEADAFAAEAEESSTALADGINAANKKGGKSEPTRISNTPKTIKRDSRSGATKASPQKKPGGLRRVTSDPGSDDDEDFDDEKFDDEEPTRTIKRPTRTTPINRGGGLKQVPTNNSDGPQFEKFKPKLDPRVTPPKLQPKPKPLSHTAVLDQDSGENQ